jgi:hypothetical protein
MTSQTDSPFEVGPFTRIYDPSVGEAQAWYINDHFVLRRGASYYLFICNNDRKGGYDATDVYRSRDPFRWSLSDKVGKIPAHAPEVLRDKEGKWYVSHCGWERGGLYLAPLAWHDGEEENECIYTPSVGIQASEGVFRMRHQSKIQNPKSKIRNASERACL